MKSFSFALCLFSFISAATAQTPVKPKTMDLGNIVSDSGSVNRDMGARFGLAPLNSSTGVIEIRLFSNIGFPGAQCVVLQYDKTWKATKYKLDAKDATIRTVLKPASGIEPIVRSLIALNIFSLPTQQALNSGNYKLDLATNTVNASAMHVSDAPCYYVQFKAGNSSREYSYCDPKAYAAFYKSQREYSDFANILKAFAKLELK